ncbi:hypothetical protein ACKWTF_000606 [Chironomus riparius]
MEVPEVSPYKAIKLEDFFEFQLKIFKLIGLNIIPIEITSLRTKIIEKLMKYYFFACIIGIWLTIIQFGIRLIIDINNLDVVVRILPNITIFPYNCSKGILFFTKRKNILDILEKLRNSFPTTRVEQQKCNLQGRLKWFLIVYKVYIVFYLATISSATIGMLYQLIFNNIRKPAVEIWFPFDDTANDRNLILSLLWLIWTVPNAAVNVISADFYLFAIVLILSTEFNIFAEDIRKAINKGQTSNLRELLVHHQLLIEISENIKTLFTFIFFYTFIQGAVSISSCGFQLLTAPSLADLLYSISYTACSLSQVFLYCFYGEKLNTASQDVGKRILDSKWYELKNIRMKKSMLFIIMRSQKPCMLSGFGFVSLSIEAFSSVSLISFGMRHLLFNSFLSV